MTEIGEMVTVPGLDMAEKETTKKPEKCTWKDCKENHEKKIKYPEGGVVTRNSSYESAWVGAGLEPWVLHGAGKNSEATLQDYRGETPAAKYSVTAAAMVHPAYHTQKHHLLSVNFFDSAKKVAHNAKLVGYDVNHKKNGICLPSYVIDIVRHDLQCHRGSHPKVLYNNKVEALLKDMEKKCIKYCHGDTDGDKARQLELMQELNRLSRRVEQQILAWKWLLRSNALAERMQSKARYESLP